jgi:hypothetical protein
MSHLFRNGIRRLLTEPPPPPLPGANLEPGFRRRWLGFFLPAAFLSLWLMILAVGFNWEAVGLDARIYYHGSAAWLAGQDPWATGVLLNGRLFSYAGLPPTAMVLAPMTYLPEEAFVWLWLLMSLGAAFAVVRALRLPALWFAYPPLLYGVMSANPNVVVLALLVAAGTWGGALASVIKVVTIPPLVGERRWRALLLAAVAMGASVLLAPGLWSEFLHQAGAIQNTISAESGGGLSAWGRPLVLIPTVVALVVLARIDLRASAWLVVPALFPTTQYHYALFALPVDPFLAAGMAFPLPLVAPIMTIAYTVVRVGVVIWRRRRGAPQPDPLALGQPQDRRGATGTGGAPTSGL